MSARVTLSEMLCARELYSCLVVGVEVGNLKVTRPDRKADLHEGLLKKVEQNLALLLAA